MIGDIIVVLQIDDEKVREIAFNLSQEPKSWDDWVWLFAEAELRLRPAYQHGKIFADNDESKTVELKATLIVDQPDEDEIRALAEEISKQGPSLQDLHWWLAERQYVYNTIKNNE